MSSKRNLDDSQDQRTDQRVLNGALSRSMMILDQIIIEAKEQIEADISITPLSKSRGFIRDLSQRVVDILLDILLSTQRRLKFASKALGYILHTLYGGRSRKLRKQDLKT